MTEQDRLEMLAEAIAERGDGEADFRAQFAPGTHGCHEAMHVSCIASDLVAERLCEHPAILLNPEWYALAEKAADALFQLYQAIGEKHMGETRRAEE